MSPDSFSAAFAHLHLLSHPFYQAWMAGTLPREVLPDYAAQYYHHVDRFPRYLSAIHSHCEDAEQRRQLLENLNDEEGVGYPASHPDLWLQFAEGVGAPRAQVLATEPRAAIRAVADTFFELSRSSFHEGLGALFAYESQVPEIAASKIEGLRSRYGVTDAKTLEFFEVHRTADVEHRAEILAMLESLPEAQKAEARAACEKAAGSLWNFLSEVYAHA
jgi:pyrroloquinoline-quinone synthase